jgi:F-type H+-transporting ATPase subunit epsilon
MQLDILTPDKNLFTGKVKYISLPGADGLEDHAPLITVLKKGTIRIEGTEGNQEFEVNGGVVEVLKNKVIILAE